MQIDQIRLDGALVVVPVGRIDSTTSGALEDHLFGLISSGEHRLVVDFASVEYISSAGLRVMLALAKRLRDAKGSVALCAMGDPVRQVFELAGFLPLFVVDESRDAAVRKVTGS
jgi:anti-anti-sigma factor